MWLHVKTFYTYECNAKSNNWSEKVLEEYAGSDGFGLDSF